MRKKLSAYWLLAGLSDAVQTVAITWMAFEMTRSAAVVAVLGVLLYLPGVLFGFFGARLADKGNAYSIFSRTNLLLATSAVATGVCMFFLEGRWLSLLVGGILIASLSVVKVFNKALVGRIIRGQFESKEVKRALQKGTSFGVIGTGLGSMLVGVGYGSVGVGGLILGSALCLFVNCFLFRRAAPATVPEAGDTPPGTRMSEQEEKQTTSVARLLMYTFFASGLLPFMNTVLVPYVGDVLSQGVEYYSMLTAGALVGSFLAGYVLRLWEGMEAWILRFGTIGAVVPMVILVLYPSPIIALPAVLLLSCILTSLILSIQIGINLGAPQGKVGSSSLRRSSSAGLSKAVFALLAGAIVDASNSLWAWGVAVVYLLGLCLWWNASSRATPI